MGRPSSNVFWCCHIRPGTTAFMLVFFALGVILQPAAGQDSPTTPPSSSMSNDIIFGICSGVVILILLVSIIALAVYLCSKAKNNFASFNVKKADPEEFELTKAEVLTNNNGPVAANGSANQNHGLDNKREVSYYRYESSTMATDSPGGIPLVDFPKYVHKNRQSLELIEEFQALPGAKLEQQSYAGEEQNKPKNRYRNILPYNKARVVLEKIGEDPYSDYINASYIDSFDREKAYIASQGPKKTTIADFWRMVWQENIRIISMLTKVEEGLKKKCDCYWPETRGQKDVYGEVSVQAQAIQERDFGVVRKFAIKKSSEETREVIQFQFTKWPDKSVPKQTSLFLRYFKEVKDAYQKEDSSPLLVHCSAGIGRSGVFIALDSVATQARKSGKVDVHGYVQTMREFRQNMVQTDEQYVFLHEAILELMLCNDTRIPVAQFEERFAQLKEKEPSGSKTHLAAEFQTLSVICPDPSPLAIRTGSKHECSFKNRDSTILPIERNRAMLQTQYSDDPTGDYINASFVKSSEGSMFIVTQMPLPKTLVDFWTLIYDYKPTKVVMLNQLDDEDETCAQYWPDDGSMEIGPFTVSNKLTEKHDTVIERVLQVQLTGSQNIRVIQQYQFLGWPSDPGQTDSRKPLLDLVHDVYQQHLESSGKILVHCMNGAGRSGVFCTLKLSIDQAAEERAIDVFQTVKSLRTDRMRMVTTEEDYLLCYEAIGDHLKNHVEVEMHEEPQEHAYQNFGFVQE